MRSDQLGIEFTGDTPPLELMEQYNESLDQFPAVRVTATITGDQRLQKQAVFGNGSPSSRDTPLFLDVSNRFLDDYRVESGLYQSRFFKSDSETQDPVFERDDSQALQQFVNDVLWIESAAVVGGVFPLFEIRTEYELGNLLVTVAGRNLSMNRFASAGMVRYPQITGIEWDFTAQTTTLYAEPNDGATSEF